MALTETSSEATLLGMAQNAKAATRMILAGDDMRPKRPLVAAAHSPSLRRFLPRIERLCLAKRLELQLASHEVCEKI